MTNVFPAAYHYRPISYVRYVRLRIHQNRYYNQNQFWSRSICRFFWQCACMNVCVYVCTRMCMCVCMFVLYSAYLPYTQSMMFTWRPTSDIFLPVPFNFKKRLLSHDWHNQWPHICASLAWAHAMPFCVFIISRLRILLYVNVLVFVSGAIVFGKIQYYEYIDIRLEL